MHLPRLRIESAKKHLLILRIDTQPLDKSAVLVSPFLSICQRGGPSLKRPSTVMLMDFSQSESGNSVVFNLGPRTRNEPHKRVTTSLRWSTYSPWTKVLHVCMSISRWHSPWILLRIYMTDDTARNSNPNTAEAGLSSLRLITVVIFSSIRYVVLHPSLSKSTDSFAANSSSICTSRCAQALMNFECKM